jgi:hypothetical protein
MLVKPASSSFCPACAERIPITQCSTTFFPASCGTCVGSKVERGRSLAPGMCSVAYSRGSRTSIRMASSCSIQVLRVVTSMSCRDLVVGLSIMQHSLRRRDGYQPYAPPRLRGRVGGCHYSMQRKRHQQSGQQTCEYGIVRDHGSQSEGWFAVRENTA